MKAQSFSKSNDNKLIGLEIIRFISAFAVLVFHYKHFAYIADTPIGFTKEQQPFFNLLGIFFNHGSYGVQVFWCISGFIFFWKYKDSLADGKIDGATFFLLRFSRLYPLHIVTLLVIAVLQYIYFSEHQFYFVYQINNLKHFILQLFFASNWGLEDGDSFNGPIWSISIEVLVYVAFFLTLKNIGKSPLVNVLILASCIALKILKIQSPVIDSLAFFYAGGLSSIALLSLKATRFKKIINLLILSSTLAFLLLLRLTQSNVAYNSTFIPLIIFTPALIYVAAQYSLENRIAKMVAEMLGNLTYASYLIHFPIQLLIVIFLSKIKIEIPFYEDYFFILFILITLILSYFIFVFFEIPTQTIIRRKSF